MDMFIICIFSVVIIYPGYQQLLKFRQNVLFRSVVGKCMYFFW